MPFLPSIGVVNPTMVEFFQGVSYAFYDALNTPPSGWSGQLCEDISSGLLRTKYPIDLLSLGAGYRKWVDERRAQDIDHKATFVDSDPYERTIDIPLDEANAAMESGNAAALRPHYNKVPA